MSEEKLYAVKNDEGKYLLDSSLSMDYPEWTNDLDSTEIFVERHNAVTASNSSGGHVVTFVEEPEKVVVSPEEAKLVKNCLWTNLQDEFLNNINLLFRGRRPEDITRLKSALTNGYTVAKEKKYLVYKKLGGKQKNKQVAQAYRSSVYPGTVSWFLVNEVTNKSNESSDQFTESEIKHYGLQDCEKEEVTDDAD
ncbi:DUF1642 domain-containing protein [Lacticaseibacillus paracasei subsp. paracasei]|uniref:DUF1642 domain-containing protein n=1 Tax=Lacticaseibacillus paracasei TaxID=1597 RepID=UPI001F46BEB7|nr:DUF1642 domain-containing protein [Lacticaseibacillus paracasei]UJS06921.1 DUF1642 domain-containing protein [Lacticaseibacillus paracasei subsp. paracasei]